MLSLQPTALCSCTVTVVWVVLSIQGVCLTECSQDTDMHKHTYTHAHTSVCTSMYMCAHETLWLGCSGVVHANMYM